MTIQSTLLLPAVHQLTSIGKPPASMQPGLSLSGHPNGVIILKPDRVDSLPRRIFKLTKMLMDNAMRFLRIDTNAIARGGSLHIEWTGSEDGYFQFELFDLPGKRIYSKQIWMDKEARILNLEIPVKRSGHYLFRATNHESGISFTNKVLIQ